MPHQHLTGLCCEGSQHDQDPLWDGELCNSAFLHWNAGRSEWQSVKLKRHQIQTEPPQRNEVKQKSTVVAGYGKNGRSGTARSENEWEKQIFAASPDLMVELE